MGVVQQAAQLRPRTIWVRIPILPQGSSTLSRDRQVFAIGTGERLRGLPRLESRWSMNRSTVVREKAGPVFVGVRGKNII